MSQSSRTFVFIFLCLFTKTKASTVRFQAAPAQLVHDLSESASMRCSVHAGYDHASSSSTTSDVRHVTSIVITKNGNDDVASMTSFNAPAALTDVGNLMVKGSLLHGYTYIQLTWSDPSTMYLGQYRCTVTAVDTHGQVVHLTSDLELTAVQPALSDVISSFKTKFINQQNTIAALTTKLENQQQIITTQQQTINSQQQQLTSLAHDNTLQTDINNNLTACTSARVAFTARMFTNRGTHFGDGAHILYPHILENINGAYDPRTSVFKCNEAGVYLFNLHAMGYKNQQSCLYLDRNGEKLTHLFIDATANDLNAASTSAIVRLDVGDVVKVMTSCFSYLYQGSNTHGNSFSGALISSDKCLP